MRYPWAEVRLLSRPNQPHGGMKVTDSNVEGQMTRKIFNRLFFPDAWWHILGNKVDMLKKQKKKYGARAAVFPLFWENLIGFLDPHKRHDKD